MSCASDTISRVDFLKTSHRCKRTSVSAATRYQRGRR